MGPAPSRASASRAVRCAGCLALKAVAVVVKGAFRVSAAAWAPALGCSSARAPRQRRRRRHAAARCTLRSPCQPGPPAVVQAGWCIMPVLSAWPLIGSRNSCLSLLVSGASGGTAYSPRRSSARDLESQGAHCCALSRNSDVLSRYAKLGSEAVTSDLHVSSQYVH